MDFEFDFAVSFARSQRKLAEALAAKLTELGYRVFYDKAFEHEFLGLDGTVYFSQVFGQRAQFCIVLISQDYDERAWTCLEREAIIARQLTDRSNFLLPLITDGHHPSWLPATRLYLDIRERSLIEIASILAKRAGAPKRPLQGLPRLLWQTPVGIGTWKAKPLIRNERVYIPTSGSTWNAMDSGDGLMCLDSRTGERIWHAHTQGDANSIGLSDDLIYLGTDEGSAVCIDVKTVELFGKLPCQPQFWRHQCLLAEMSFSPLLMGWSEF